MANRWLIQGALVLDVSSGKTTRQDLGVADGFVCPTDEVDDGARIDAGGLTALFGLWDCHAHPGSLMHDPTGRGYFEGVAEWTVRAGANLMEAAQMGVTGCARLRRLMGSTCPGRAPSLPHVPRAAALLRRRRNSHHWGPWNGIPSQAGRGYVGGCRRRRRRDAPGNAGAHRARGRLDQGHVDGRVVQ